MSETTHKKDRIRVLLIAPSMGMLGGQAVQASRLLSCLNELPSLAVTFQPIDPKLPKPYSISAVDQVCADDDGVRCLLYNLAHPSA